MFFSQPRQYVVWAREAGLQLHFDDEQDRSAL